MDIEYSDWIFNSEYVEPSQLEEQVKQLSGESSEDTNQYNTNQNLPLYQPREDVDVRTDEYKKCSQTSSLDYFAHNLPGVVVKQDFLYNVHIINSRNNGSIILGWVDPTLERKEINNGSLSFAVGSGTTKFVDDHEYGHLQGTLDEGMQRINDSAKNPELARNGGIDPFYMK